MSADDIVARMREAFAEVPRPGIPPNYVPDGTLGNPGWDEFTYHSALVFAEQVPDHVQRALDSPEKYVPDLLWHLSDSERLGVFSNRQIALLVEALDLVEAEHPGAMSGRQEQSRLQSIRQTFERLLSRSE
jgi:hypothetical protein